MQVSLDSASAATGSRLSRHRAALGGWVLMHVSPGGRCRPAARCLVRFGRLAVALQPFQCRIFRRCAGNAAHGRSLCRDTAGDGHAAVHVYRAANALSYARCLVLFGCVCANLSYERRVHVHALMYGGAHKCALCTSLERPCAMLLCLYIEQTMLYQMHYIPSRSAMCVWTCYISDVCILPYFPALRGKCTHCCPLQRMYTMRLCTHIEQVILLYHMHIDSDSDLSYALDVGVPTCHINNMRMPAHFCT